MNVERMPSDREMADLIGQKLFEVWNKLCDLIESKYDTERLWDSGGREWTYEYKYRRGGKTLCTLYAKENTIGVMVIFGKYEREKFEEDRNNYSFKTQKIYDESKTYHDGKWMMFRLNDTSLFPDMEKLLLIKRKPNKK